MGRKHEPVTPAPVTDHFTHGCATKHSPHSNWLVRLYKFSLAPVYHTHLPKFTLLSYQWFACVKLCKSVLGVPVYHTHFPNFTLSYQWFAHVKLCKNLLWPLATTPPSPVSPFSLTSGLLVLSVVRVCSGFAYTCNTAVWLWLTESCFGVSTSQFKAAWKPITLLVVFDWGGGSCAFCILLLCHWKWYVHVDKYG